MALDVGDHLVQEQSRSRLECCLAGVGKERVGPSDICRQPPVALCGQMMHMIVSTVMCAT